MLACLRADKIQIEPKIINGSPRTDDKYKRTERLVALPYSLSIYLYIHMDFINEDKDYIYKILI